MRCSPRWWFPTPECADSGTDLSAPGGPLSGRGPHRANAAGPRERALAARPAALLFDEPFAALDAEGLATVTGALRAVGGTLVIAAPQVDPSAVQRILDLR